MQQIKFRAKTIKNGRWVYGYYFQSPLTDEDSGVPIGMGWHFLSDGVTRHCISQNGVVFIVDEKTVGRCTNMKDMHGVEIYEQDIVVRNVYGTVYTREVIWSDDYGCFYTAHDLFGIPTFANPRNVNVIGNIHDNPNLLK